MSPAGVALIRCRRKGNHHPWLRVRQQKHICFGRSHTRNHVLFPALNSITRNRFRRFDDLSSNLSHSSVVSSRSVPFALAFSSLPELSIHINIILPALVPWRFCFPCYPPRQFPLFSLMLEVSYLLPVEPSYHGK